MSLLRSNVAKTLGLKALPKNVYGIEVELENYSPSSNTIELIPPSLSEFWEITGDDSLRRGVEFVSKPLTQVKLRKGFSTLQTFIDRINLSSSKRCSVHVHVNARNMSWGQLYSLLSLYTYLEPYLFSKFAPERDQNHFCVPMYWNTKFNDKLVDDLGIIRIMTEADITIRKTVKKKSTAAPNSYIAHFSTSAPKPAATGSLLSRLTSVGKGQFKYSSLSMYRLWDLGTLEFRILPGTTDMQKVQEWVKLLGRLKFMATKYEDPMKLQKFIESRGASSIWASLALGLTPTVEKEITKDAYDMACRLAGQEPIDHKDLNWSIT